MEMEAIIDTVQSFDGALVVQPETGSIPEIFSGDAYFYYAPDEMMPERTQPYGTIITKDYPDDAGAALDTPGRFRVNIHVDSDSAADLPQGSCTAASPPQDATSATPRQSTSRHATFPK